MAKYRKMNLWGESNMDAGSCSHAVFEAVGARFGLVTCADLIYEVL